MKRIIFAACLVQLSAATCCASTVLSPSGNRTLVVSNRRPAGSEAVRIISPTEREVNTKAFLTIIEAVQAILEQGRASPYVVNEDNRGLRITILQESGPIRYLELEDGDVIQFINAQQVTSGRKAYQILRKARSQLLLKLQFIRGTENRTISFKVVAHELDGCFPFTYSTYSDWVALDRPACWCAAYQCDGDADGKTSGLLLNYRVYGGDLNLVVNNWKKKIDDRTLDPCADIDHKAEACEKYRVYLNDLAVLLANWRKKSAELPGDCPRPE